MKDNKLSYKELEDKVKKLNREIEKLKKPAYSSSFHDNPDSRKITDNNIVSEITFHTLFNMMSQGVICQDNKGKIILANNAAERILGLSEVQMKGKTSYNPRWHTIHENGTDYLSDNHPSMLALKKGKKVCNAVIGVNNPVKKNLIWLKVNAYPLFRQGEKKPYMVFTTFEDIIEQKYIDEALKESEQRFRTLVEKAPNGIIVHDLNGRIMIANSLICKYSGYSKEELLSMNISELDYEVIKQEHRKKYWESLKFGEHVKFNSIHTRKDKSTYPAEINLVKIMYQEQPIILGFVHDITERSQYETALQKAKEKAEESDRLKSAFLANMSHEIRTPLNGILGFADMLKNPDLSDPKRKHFIDIIQEGGQHLLQIVNDIIDISKIEARQIEVRETETDINNLLYELFTFYEPIARKKTVNLHFQKDLTDERAIIFTDSVKLQQILQNLLSNAIKFTHKGYIKFGYDAKDGFLEFYVEDTGIGIPPELHERIFDRFRQANISISREYGGTGLGLSIAKAFIRKMGGEIWLSSNPDKGTSFNFTIPYKPAKDTQEPKISKKVKDTKTKSLTVLVVEDDDVNYLYLEEILNSIKATVLHAKNGSEAVDICRNYKGINLVLMDIKLPDISGYEATLKIKKLMPEIPVIAQTAYALEGDKDKALESGCNDYIAKPLKQEQLIELILKYDKEYSGI